MNQTTNIDIQTLDALQPLQQAISPDEFNLLLELIAEVNDNDVLSSAQEISISIAKLRDNLRQVHSQISDLNTILAQTDSRNRDDQELQLTLQRIRQLLGWEQP